VIQIAGDRTALVSGKVDDEVSIVRSINQARMRRAK